MFPDSATFYPQGAGPDTRGGSRIVPASQGLTLPAYLEPGSEWADRVEGHAQPEARKKWNVFTAANPNPRVDSRVVARGLNLTVVKCERQHGAALLWRTECIEAE